MNASDASTDKLQEYDDTSSDKIEIANPPLHSMFFNSRIFVLKIVELVAEVLCYIENNF